MHFFRINIDIVIEDNEEIEAPRSRRFRIEDSEMGMVISKACEKYTEKIADSGYFFLCGATRYKSTFGMVIREKINVEKFVNGFLKTLKCEVGAVDITETTLNDFYQMLQNADRNDYIYDDEDILREYELDELVGRRSRNWGPCFDEKIIRERDKEAIYLSAKGYYTQITISPELDRIFAGTKRKRAVGHPVDYMIESDDERTLKGVSQLLIQALHNVGRIENRRYC